MWSTAAAGALFGLATHWRLYPIIYGLPILLYLQLQRPMAVRRWSSPQRDGILRQALRQLSAAWPTQGVACFSAAAAAAFLGLGAACYAAFGHAFLENAYMYHGRRVDPRHNFSPASHCLRPAVCLILGELLWPRAELAQRAGAAVLCSCCDIMPFPAYGPYHSDVMNPWQANMCRWHIIRAWASLSLVLSCHMRLQAFYPAYLDPCAC